MWARHASLAAFLVSLCDLAKAVRPVLASCFTVVACRVQMSNTICLVSNSGLYPPPPLTPANPPPPRSRTPPTPPHPTHHTPPHLSTEAQWLGISRLYIDFTKSKIRPLPFKPSWRWGGGEGAGVTRRDTYSSRGGGEGD